MPQSLTSPDTLTKVNEIVGDSDAVDNVRISPSQFDTFAKCERKWHYTYVQGFRSQPTASQAKGVKIHSILENYLKGKGPIDTTTELGRIAAAGLPYLPEPGSGSTEGHFEIIRPELSKVIGLPTVYHGYYDWSDLYTPSVIDHKTTSDFKYAKTEDVLREDPQAICYGADALRRHFSEPEVYIRWIYYRTKGAAKAKPIDLVLSREHVDSRLKVLDTIAIDMHAKRQLPLATDLQPSVNHCHEYGGCAFRDKCTDLGTKAIKGLVMSMAEQAQSFLDRLKARAAAPPPAPSTPAATPAIPPPPALPSAVSAPPSLPQPPALPTPPAPPEAGRKPGAGRPKKDHDAEAAALALAQKINAGVQAALPAIPPPAHAPAPDLVTTAPSTPVPPPLPGTKPIALAPNPAVAPIAALYVDCIPIGEQVTTAEECFKHVRQALVNDYQVPHYKLIDYGKGVGLWATGVSEWAKQNWSNAVVYVDTMTNEGKDALDALMSVAAKVVRGIR